MRRRRSPRPAAEAVRAVRERAAPATPLAAAQAAWPEVVGEAIAAAAAPVAERDGVLTVACDSAVWAQELELMQGQLLERLRSGLGAEAPRALRFRVREA